MTPNIATIRDRVARYIRVRWIFLITLTISGLTTQYISEGFSRPLLLNLMVSVAVMSFNAALQAASHWRRNSLSFQHYIATALILADIIAASFLIYNNGGIESRTIILFAIPMVGAGAFFSRRAVYALATLSGVLYDTILLLDYHQLIPRQVINIASIHGERGSVLVACIFYPATFFMVAYVSDYVLTLLKEREAQLKQTSEALKDAQASVHLGNWDWDILRNRLIWSEELYRIFGIEPDKFGETYEAYLDLVDPADRDNVDSVISQARQVGSSFSLDHRIVRKDGTVRQLSVQGNVEMDESAQPVRVVGTAQDITERKLVEESLRRTQAELEKFNKQMIGRELKMVELKRELSHLKEGGKHVQSD